MIDGQKAEAMGSACGATSRSRNIVFMPCYVRQSAVASRHRFAYVDNAGRGPHAYGFITTGIWLSVGRKQYLTSRQAFSSTRPHFHGRGP